MDIRCVPLTADHLIQAVGLSELAGWPHRERDWQQLLSLGQGKALIDNDQLIATAMHWASGPALTTLGMVIVAPTHQRLGLGRQLMQAVLDEISTARIELHATEEGVALYRDLGFHDIAGVHQCQGGVAGTGRVSPPLPGQLLREMRGDDVEAFIRLDEQACGTLRDRLLSALLAYSDAQVIEHEDGRLAGVALCREFGHGLVIGPVVADSPAVARCLIGAWLERLVGGFVRVDTPDPVLAEWLGACGLKEVNRVHQMSTTGDAGSGGSVIRYALASQALG
ncbi:GNAT family N-acetyltransferase [Halomonas sp. ML-15]|uniref:GNAT family N-acetyltransferase n=1 Tax=Halomonas sp. ML-15 TaxID=2773305 RepID=UPI0017470379|nr:GNAT family N-acetyltransferase [Halomonas sp. ML-15]MBD3896337.1 GNAT family N-acetyltransferase [Halomonas sp. ML-15]